MRSREDVIQDLIESDRLDSGHYLDRRIALCEILGLSHYEYMLRGIAVFIEKSHKPSGLDAMLAEVDGVTLSRCRVCYQMTDEDLILIAWANDRLTHIRK